MIRNFCRKTHRSSDFFRAAAKFIIMVYKVFVVVFFMMATTETPKYDSLYVSYKTRIKNFLNIYCNIIKYIVSADKN